MRQVAVPVSVPPTSRAALPGVSPMGSAVAGKKAVSAQEGAGRTNVVRIADAAKCEVYVCFEGPLGAHLKPKVKEKIVRGEYVVCFYPWKSLT